MRIKLDFITNSSTTCFFAWGTSIEWYDNNIEKYSKTIGMAYICEVNKLNFNALKLEGNYYVENFRYVVQNLCNLVGLQTGYDYGSCFVHIGLSPFEMKPDETLSQFKDRVKKCFNAIYLPSSDLYQIEESWND